MTNEQLKQLKGPWRVIVLGSTDHGCAHGENQDFAFDVVDAEGNLICETDNKKMAEVITRLPSMLRALMRMSRHKPEIICHIGGEELTCSSCEALIEEAGIIMRSLEVFDD